MESFANKANMALLVGHIIIIEYTTDCWASHEHTWELCTVVAIVKDVTAYFAIQLTNNRDPNQTDGHFC